MKAVGETETIRGYDMPEGYILEQHTSEMNAEKTNHSNCQSAIEIVLEKTTL